MIDITDEEIAAAEERGRIADDREARATSAYYDRKTGLLVVELKHTATFSFPARLAQGLANATDDEIAEVEVIGTGYGLHWEKLDADHAVPALVAGHFGTRKYMASLVERGIIEAYGNHGAGRGTPRKAAG
ncbi:MAG: DUF2442 domain-containing protein [Devosia sp.]|jgi:hypothetical protein|nr:DUF2442 domain-containing protein [Devosia sp.]